ncbi:MAG: four helix bundle protein [Planctomycetes bacterium]|nr:four helix bundle protein [Planctomycetota bacterium]
MTPDELSDRLLDFAARIGKVVDSLPDSRLGRHVGGQMIRCGTSPGPNYEESRAAESKADFVHKLKIVLKELRETRYWLRLVVKTGLLPSTKMNELIDEATQLCNIFGQSIVTCKGIKKSENRDPPNQL